MKMNLFEPRLSQPNNQPDWVLETSQFQLLEYPAKPKKLSCKLIHKESGNFWAFAFLGIERQRFENCDPKVLDGTLFLLANYLIGLEANLSVCSLWANLPYAFPNAEEIQEFDPSDIEVLRAIAAFINYGEDLF